MATATAPEIKITGKSGLQYTFFVYPIGTTFNKVGGIYFFVKVLGLFSNYSAIYLGITNDLSERFDNHHKMPCIKKNGATHIFAMREDNESTRQKTEKDILLAINTTCNEVHN